MLAWPVHDTQGRGERRPAVLHRGLTTNRRDLSAVLQEKEKSARMPMGSRVSNVEIALKSKMKHVKQRTLAFFQHEAAGGIVLLAAAVLALILANSPLHHAYELLLETPVTVRIGEAGIDKHLIHWINDGLMAVFFLLVGLEIKREMMVGALSSPARASLPAIAA